MSFTEGVKKIIQRVKNIHEVNKMDKGVSDFKKMREAMKNVSAKKVGAK